MLMNEKNATPVEIGMSRRELLFFLVCCGF